MRNWFKNSSIYKKLISIQMITSFVAVLLSASIFLLMDYSFMRESKMDSTLSLGNVLSSNLVAPILFQDEETIEENLNNLSVDKDIRHAWVLDNKGKLILEYHGKSQTSKPIPAINLNKKRIEQGVNLYNVFSLNDGQEKIGKLILETSMEGLRQQLFRKIVFTLLIISIVFLLAFYLATIFQRSISKPIEALVSLMNRVKRNHDYALRTEIIQNDEIGQLSASFNEMLDQIEQNSQELSELNSELEKKIEERTEELIVQNRKLDKAKKAAEESKVVKEQFLASMSHEIRTPLNAILGFKDLLKSTKLSNEQTEYVNSIDFAGQNLMVIINDILDLSKIEAGKFEFSRNHIDIHKNIQSVIELIQQRAAEKGLKIELKQDKAVPQFLIGDDARLTQILINLLGNAVKFTEKGEITVTINVIKKGERQAILSYKVADTGIGIAPENIDLIFNRFTQESSETNRRFGGTGLGLTIVKQLVELQGGSIHVESVFGKGSVFSFELPFEVPSKGHEQKVQIGSAVAAENISLEGFRILVAEDMVLNQNLIRKILQKWKTTFEIASNGYEALNYLKTHAFDLILMDIQMPEMDGYETTKFIRNNPTESISKIPIIALTAHASNAEAEKCLNLGMNAYMAKPFNANELKQVIYDIVNNIKEKKTNVARPYDLGYLYEHADGDYDFLKEMIEIFIKDSPLLIEDLKNAIDTRDFDKIRISSHSMKGIFLTLGIHKAAYLIREIENLALMKQNLDKILENCKVIESIYQESKIGLEKELKKL